MNILQLTITSTELSHKGKVVLIKQFLDRCSGSKTTYSLSITENQLAVSPAFKSQEAFDSVEAGITDILNDMCKELDNRGCGCSHHYNCCDCGGNDCGCAYCFSCRACEYCLDNQ